MWSRLLIPLCSCLGLLAGACADDPPVACDSTKQDSGGPAESDEDTAADPCADSLLCVGQGLCELAPRGYCSAGSDFHCLRSDLCKYAGYCTLVDGDCAVTATTDCTHTLGCLNQGFCVEDGGECRAGSASDCSNSLMCVRDGYCGYHAGRCVLQLDSSFACSASSDCKFLGNCSLVNGMCLPDSDADCQQSADCVDSGLCTVVDHVCRNTSLADCQASLMCKKNGHCSSMNGRCSPASQADCDAADKQSGGTSIFLAGRCRQVVGSGVEP